MENAILVLVLVAILIPAIRHCVLRIRGKRSCCGATTEKVPVKKLKGEIKERYLLQVEGMRCENCKNSVMRNLNALEGISVKVNLSKKTVAVECCQETDPELIRRTVTKLGYDVVKIEHGKHSPYSRS